MKAKMDYRYDEYDWLIAPVFLSVKLIGLTLNSQLVGTKPYMYLGPRIKVYSIIHLSYVGSSILSS